MSSVNRVFLMGNLTRKPEVRHTPSGMAVADLGLAVSDSYKNKAGETVESTCFADIVVWGRQAETCEQYLGKGSPVLVEGRLQFDQWQTEQGEKRSRLRVRADRVQFMGGKKGQARDAASGAAQSAGVAERSDDEQGETFPF
jgi:single-strand DNA-binding protein